MSGANGGSKSKSKKDDGTFDLEQQILLRMPPGPAMALRKDVESGNLALRDKFFIELKHDMRHGLIRYGDKCFKAKLKDLPCIIETLKTVDNKNFYKTADLCQMMVCVSEDDSSDEDIDPGQKSKDKDKKNQINHGATAPLKNVRKKRFRKTLRKKYQEQPDIEKEVKRLLRMDNEAIDVKWEVVADDSRTDNTQDSQSAPQVLAHGGSSKIPNIKEEDSNMGLEQHLFGDISSSDEDEKDINVTDSGDDDMLDSANTSQMAAFSIKDEYSLSAELNEESDELQVKLTDLGRQLAEMQQSRIRLEERIEDEMDQEVKESLTQQVEESLENEREKEREFEILSSMLDQ